MASTFDQRIQYDGQTYPLPTFLDCYQFEPYDPEKDYRPGERFEVVTEDARVLGPIYGYEIYAARPIAVKFLWSGSDIIDGALPDIEEDDDWEDDDDCCPNCGYRL